MSLKLTAPDEEEDAAADAAEEEEEAEDAYEDAVPGRAADEAVLGRSCDMASSKRAVGRRMQANRFCAQQLIVACARQAAANLQ